MCCFLADEFLKQSFSEHWPFAEESGRLVFKECSFHAIDLTDLTLERCVFESCKFFACRMGASVFRGCRMTNCIFELCSFFDTVFDSCKLTGSVFYETDCTCFSILRGDWSFTDVRDLDFYKMKLCGVNFDHADFTGCCLDQAMFQDCNLSHIKVGNTSAVGTDFRSSAMDGVDFRGILMKKTKIDLTQAILLASCMGAECI